MPHVINDDINFWAKVHSVVAKWRKDMVEKIKNVTFDQPRNKEHVATYSEFAWKYRFEINGKNSKHILSGKFAMKRKKPPYNVQFFEPIFFYNSGSLKCSFTLN